MTDTYVVARVPLRVVAPVTTMTLGFERLFAASVGVIVLPLYAPQPLLDLIGPSLGLSLRTASLVAMIHARVCRGPCSPGRCFRKTALAGVAWVEAGWTLVCVVGLMFGVIALALGSIGRSADDATETVRNLGTIPRVRNPLQRRR